MREVLEKTVWYEMYRLNNLYAAHIMSTWVWGFQDVLWMGSRNHGRVPHHLVSRRDSEDYHSFLSDIKIKKRKAVI